MSNAQRILVIGGAGYISSHCLRRLQNAGKTPVVLDSEVYGHRAAVPAEIPYYKGDLGDTALLKSIFEKEKIDTVMHFAAQSHVDKSFGNSFEFTQTNILGTHVLLECAKNFSIRRFIHVSTDEVYGEDNVKIINKFKRMALLLFFIASILSGISFDTWSKINAQRVGFESIMVFVADHGKNSGFDGEKIKTVQNQLAAFIKENQHRAISDDEISLVLGK
jgi:hypothetical protein